MMKVNVKKPALIPGDKKTVIVNTIIPNSVLKKKQCVVNYHQIHEMCACQVLKINWCL